MVEHRTENPGVVSPILTRGKSKNGVWPSWLRRLLWEQESGGSSPLTPTRKLYNLNTNRAPLAQWIRAAGFGPVGREFESLRAQMRR